MLKNSKINQTKKKKKKKHSIHFLNPTLRKATAVKKTDPKSDYNSWVIANAIKVGLGDSAMALSLNQKKKKKESRICQRRVESPNFDFIKSHIFFLTYQSTFSSMMIFYNLHYSQICLFCSTQKQFIDC